MQTRDKTECRYDMLALGEVMLRLDPGDTRIKCARSFDAYEGGGEYNVARGLHKCFGLRTGVLTALVNNDVGQLIYNLMQAGGTDVSHVRWAEFDGIGARARNGLNFTERGFSVRGALGVSDRANTAAAQLKPGDFDFDDLFGKQGVRWLHTGGIFAALSDSTAALTEHAMQKAQQYGVKVSYDLNYRPSLWKDRGGKERAQQVNGRLARFVDVMLGNEEDFSACLGISVGSAGTDLTILNLSDYEMTMRKAAEQYPNLSVIASTLRQAHTASFNDWSAICYEDGKLYRSKAYENLLIFDRVGGGDSFASGLIYGLMEKDGAKEAVEYGAAHGALAMTTPGDTSMASQKEVEALIRGAGARISR